MELSPRRLARFAVCSTLAAVLFSCSKHSSKPPLQGFAQDTDTAKAESDADSDVETSPDSDMGTGSESETSTDTFAWPNGTSTLGSNLALFGFCSGSWPFVDAIHSSTPFFSGNTKGIWDDHRLLDKDEHGWVRSLEPDQVARTFVVGYACNAPVGKYTITWSGSGTIEAGGARSMSEKEPFGMVAYVDQETSLWLTITRTDPADYLRDIRVILPGGRCADEPMQSCTSDKDCNAQPCVPFTSSFAEEIFHPDFLDEHKRFRALRFADWLATDRLLELEDGVLEPLPLREWSDYPTRQDPFWQPVPLEVIFELSQKLHADVWLNVPHEASDELVSELADAAASKLADGLSLYIELSSSTWDQRLDQHHYFNRRGCEARSKNPFSECQRPGEKALCEPKAEDEVLATCRAYGAQQYGLQAAKAMRAFEDAFADYPFKKLVRVLGGHTGAVSAQGALALDVLWDGVEPASAHFDAVAVDAFFGQGFALASAEEAFATNAKEVDGAPAGTYTALTASPESGRPGLLAALRADLAYLEGRPDAKALELLAYSGGQHFTSPDPSLRALQQAANRDPQMTDLYLQYLAAWAELTGGALLVHSTSPQNWNDLGCFGSKEFQGQKREQAPKFHALETFVEQAL